MPEKRRINVWVLAFLALLWLGATFAFFGNTGKHSDDYWTTFRSIDGAGYDWSNHPWRAWKYFWRPLHLIHIWFNNTVFWSMDWVPHLELALVHACVCWLLFTLLIRLGSARGPAFAAAVLFGTFPLLGEAIGWSSASCNAISSALMLWTLLLVHRMAGGETGRAWKPLLGIALVGFAAACFYEPGAAGLSAAPLVAWAASRGRPPHDRIRRAGWACLAAGLPCVVYVVLLRVTATQQSRGGADHAVSLQDLPAVAAHFLREVKILLWGARGRDILLGSFEQGWGLVRHRTSITVIFLATALAGIAALWSWARSGRAIGAEPDERGPGGLLPLLGLAFFFVPLAPFIIDGAKGIEPRSIYVSMLGVACGIAAAGNALRRVSMEFDPPRRRVLTAIGLGAAGLLAILGQIGLIGMQGQFRGNAKMDARLAEQLQSLSPKVAPQSSLLFLACEHRGAATSRPRYNGALHTAVEATWSATTFVRRAMKRKDVHLISGQYWERDVLPAGSFTPTDLRRNRGGDPIPWSQVIPVWVDHNAEIHVVGRLTIQSGEGEPFEVRPARAGALAETGAGIGFRLIELGPGKCRVVREALPIPSHQGQKTLVPQVPIIQNGEQATPSGR